MAEYGWYYCEMTKPSDCHARWKINTSYSGRELTCTVTLQLYKEYARSWNNDELKNFYITIGSYTKYFTVTEVPVASAGNGVNLSWTRTFTGDKDGTTNVYFSVGGSLNGTRFKISGNRAKTKALSHGRATYTVKYYANGGSGAPSSQTKYHGTDLKLSSTEPTRTNYIFDGWGTSSTSKVAAYDPGDYYDDNESENLYAIWTAAKTTRIRYYFKGGHSGPGWQKKTATETITLSTTKPQRDGYTFSHWETSAGTKYNPGSSYSGSKSLSLYARWTPKVTTIKYNVNGGEPSDQTLPETRTISGVGYISAGWSPNLDKYIRPKKPGYLFKGWCKDSAGSGRTYYNGYDVNSLAAGGTITLYAIYVDPGISLNDDGRLSANEFNENSSQGIKLEEGGIVSTSKFVERSTAAGAFSMYPGIIYTDQIRER